jgi:hypothetical protein
MSIGPTDRAVMRRREEGVGRAVILQSYFGDDASCHLNSWLVNSSILTYE